MADRGVARTDGAYRRVVGLGLPLAWAVMVWLSACAQGVAVESELRGADRRGDHTAQQYRDHQPATGLNDL